MRAHECAAEEFSGGLSRVKWSQACVARTHTSLHKAGVKGEEEAAAAGARRNLTSARACWDEERRSESAAAAIHGGYWGALLGRYLALAGGRLYFLFDEPCGQAVGQEETKQAIETLQHPYRACCVVGMHVADLGGHTFASWVVEWNPSIGMRTNVLNILGQNCGNHPHYLSKSWQKELCLQHARCFYLSATAASMRATSTACLQGRATVS